VKYHSAIAKAYKKKVFSAYEVHGV